MASNPVAPLLEVSYTELNWQGEGRGWFRTSDLSRA